ncbi:MAG: ABC transporter ATP-binding protein/permease [Symbiobacteriaceae bacterium]|nr:ABC transporter ATP-binding protein/permease [Symbiobacteriaceae bacterium]
MTTKWRDEGDAVMNIYARLARDFMQKYWHRYLLAFALVNLVTWLGFRAPLLTQRIIDDFIPTRDMDNIIRYALMIVVVAVARGLTTFVQRYNLEYTAQKVVYDIRNRLYMHIQELSFSFYDSARTGELMSRLTSDVETLRGAMGMAFINLISNILQIVYAMAILLSLNVQLTLISLVFMPFLIWAVREYAIKVRPTFRMVQEQMAKLTAVMQENITGIRVVKAFAQEEYEVSKFSDQNTVYFQKALVSARLDAFYSPLMTFISGLSSTFILWYGGNAVINGTLQLGEWMIFNTLLLQLIQPVRMFGWLVSMVQRAAASGGRLYEVLDTKSDVADSPQAVDMPPVTGLVEFDNVTFSYDKRMMVLEELTFTAEPGQTIAILGPTGSGKSSVISLIPRFYDPLIGTIRIDGRDIRDYKVESLRKQVGIVLQETFLFGDSLRANIAYGKPDASDEEIISAAQSAKIHDFIMGLPDGYDTTIGERGVGLSGGQKQRVAIARAILMQARILILDESTSSVDTETEHAIQQAFAQLTANCTTFIIAQRLSTVRNADKILVLDRGRLVQEGHHEDLLLDPDGIYAKIYEMQLRPQEKDVSVTSTTKSSGGDS